MLHRFSELLELNDADSVLKRAVELCLETIGLVRAGFYLFDEPANLMLGTWGTSIQRQVIDEHHAMFELGPHGERVFTRALAGTGHWTVVENCPLIDLGQHSSQVVGQGWVVNTPIHCCGRRLGMLYNDAGLTDAALDPLKQTHAALLCAQVGIALRQQQHSNQFADLPSVSARHPVLRRAVHRLSRDPSLSGDEIAQALGISVSHLARVFKSELGVSLVDYRNQLRLERFSTLMAGGSSNLLEAALMAGFGSYAQFHRVFRAVRGESPREYCATRGIRLSRRV